MISRTVVPAMFVGLVVSVATGSGWLGVLVGGALTAVLGVARSRTRLVPFGTCAWSAPRGEPSEAHQAEAGEAPESVPAGTNDG